MSPRLRAHIDANQPSIVDALRRVGADVILLHQLGRDKPDLLVGFRRRNVLMEVKNPDGRNRVEPGQQAFIDAWPGEVVVVRTATEALHAIGITTVGEDTSWPTNR